jgi:hypothetical protein
MFLKAVSLALTTTWIGPILTTAPTQEKPAVSAAAPFPTEQHRRLDDLVGQWDVTTRYTLGPGQEREGSATCEVKWILDGHVLQEEYHSQMQGRPFVVLQYLGYDAAQKRFFEIKFDNMDTGVLHNQGTISDNGKVITQTGERNDPRTGKTSKIRTVTTIVDRDHFTIEWFLPDDEGHEQRMVLLDHTRKAL